MRYEEPNMQILLTDEADIVRTSSVKVGDGIPKNDSQVWPIQ